MTFLLTIIFLLPLLSSYKGFGYEQIKVLFFLISISLIGLIWLLRKQKFKLTSVGKAAGIFIAVLSLASILGIDPKASILGSPPYFQGLILYAYLFLFFLLVSSSDIKLKTFAMVLAGSASVVSIVAITDWILLNIFNQQVFTYAGRVVSTFGQPNFYSGFILMTLPFWYLLLKKRTKQWPFVTAGFLISVLAIIISQSKAAFLILGALFLLWSILELRYRKLIILMAVLGVISLAGLFFEQVTKPVNVANADLIDLTKVSVEKRVYIWPIFMKFILERPIAGYGLENISTAYSNYFQDNYHSLFEENLRVSPLLIRLKDLNIARTHNYTLDLLFFSGGLGLLSWLFLVGLLIKKLFQSEVGIEATTLLIGLFSYLIWIQIQNQSVVHLVYFWFLAGAIDKKLEM